MSNTAIDGHPNGVIDTDNKGTPPATTKDSAPIVHEIPTHSTDQARPESPTGLSDATWQSACIKAGFPFSPYSDKDIIFRSPDQVLKACNKFAEPRNFAYEIAQKDYPVTESWLDRRYFITLKCTRCMDTIFDKFLSGGIPDAIPHTCCLATHPVPGTDIYCESITAIVVEWVDSHCCNAHTGQKHIPSPLTPPIISGYPKWDDEEYTPMVKELIKILKSTDDSRGAFYGRRLVDVLEKKRIRVPDKLNTEKIWTMTVMRAPRFIFCVPDEFMCPRIVWASVRYADLSFYTPDFQDYFPTMASYVLLWMILKWGARSTLL